MTSTTKKNMRVELWTFKEFRAKLNISKVRSDFLRIEEGDLTLITPKKNMWDWEEEEKFLRSVVVDKDGYVVSCGWPKFGNYGEFLDNTETLNRSLRDGSPVRFSHKEDGSLCIRSVINDEVVLRTRGTLFGGVGTPEQESFGERFFKVAQKYPKLLDETWMADRSLLFEYVSPDNNIVVKYDEEDLIFIGFVDHGLHIGHWEEVKSVADEAQFNLVRLHDLPRDPTELINCVKTWKDEGEGIVARCDQDQVFVKIKSAHYLAMHRMKFRINYKFMVEFVELSGVKNEQELISELKECDYDYEIIETTIPFYRRYKKAELFFEENLKKAKDILENREFDSKDDEVTKRKRLALSIVNIKNPVKSLIFSLYDANMDKVLKLRRKMLINEMTK